MTIQPDTTTEMGRKWAAMMAAKRAERAKLTPKPAPHPADGMNKTEAAFGRHLDGMKGMGEVIWWRFNEVRLRIAKGRNAWFKPDFVVQFADGHFEFFEAKGFEREAAIVRIKVAAGAFPFKFTMVKRHKGEWIYKVI